jgi:hypothetical protein
MGRVWQLCGIYFRHFILLQYDETTDSSVINRKTKAHGNIILENKNKIQKNLYSDWRQSGSLPENLEGRQEESGSFQMNFLVSI